MWNLKKKVGKLLISHRSTIYPCYVPILGDSTGAGRTRLTHGKGSKLLINGNIKKEKYYFFLS